MMDTGSMVRCIDDATSKGSLSFINVTLTQA